MEQFPSPADDQLESVAPDNEQTDDVVAAIAKKKARIKEIEEADTKGTLSSQYSFSPDYMDRANEEVVNLENEIRQLEDSIAEKAPLRSDHFDDTGDEPDPGGPEAPIGDGEGEGVHEELAPEPEAAAAEQEAIVEPEEAGRRKIGVVETNARTVTQALEGIATNRRENNRQELRGFRGFATRIWQYGLRNKFYQQREIQRVRDEIAGDNVHHLEETAHTNPVKQAIVDRFLSDNPDLFDTLTVETGVTKGYLTDLIGGYANGQYDDKSFEKQCGVIFSEILGLNVIKNPNSFLMSGQLLELAKEARRAVQSGEALANLDLDFDLVVGRIKSRARTEAEADATQFALDMLQYHPDLWMGI